MCNSLKTTGLTHQTRLLRGPPHDHEGYQETLERGRCARPEDPRAADGYSRICTWVIICPPLLFQCGELEFERFRWPWGDSRILLRGCKRPGYRKRNGVQENYPPVPPLHSSPRVTCFLNTMQRRCTSGLYIRPEIIISTLSAWWSCISKSSISENVLAPSERRSNRKHLFFVPLYLCGFCLKEILLDLYNGWGLILCTVKTDVEKTKPILNRKHLTW